MDFDLDDLIFSGAVNTAKAGKKFQPKAKPKPKPKPNAQPEPKSIPTPSTQCVEVAATAEEQTGNNANQIIGNVLDSLQSSVEKSQEENAESFLTSDLPNDTLPESTTTTGNLPTCSETPTADVSVDGKLETGPTEPELISNVESSTNLESIAELDPLTGEEGAIFNENEDFHVGDLSSGSKGVENSFFLEPLDILAPPMTGSGPRVSKFKPKPKAQSRRLEQIASHPDQDVGPVQHEENIQSAPFQTDFMENEHVPSFTQDEIYASSLGITDSVDFHVNEEFTEIPKLDSANGAGGSSKRVRRLANKALQLIDKDENDGVDDNNNNNDDYVPENESLIEKNDNKSKRKSKSKKSVSDDQKPVRKRKKVTEVPDELTEVPKKKFSHSTKRNKRPVNPELLNIAQDEFELHMHNFTLKDLIRLREHNERIEKKAASSGKNATDQSDAQNATFYNYHTHMKITPRVKWTKQDTELFYEAIQQFGTDLSMITECFPGRTREQIRSKFKKEYKQNRLRIESALNTRAKGHSHFEFVIERLKKARAEDSENEDPFNFTGEEDEVQADAEINVEGELEKEKEVKETEADENPTNGNDIEEDDTWMYYKSDI